MERKSSILKGTALLTGAGLLVKLLGAAYRIPLSRLIGSEGIGLYQMAYPIYLIFLSLATAGVPIAISKLIAEQSIKDNQAGIRKVFKAALLLLLILGFSGSVGMVLVAPLVAGKVVSDPRAVYAMWALAPSIFFMSLMAVFRGFFQGHQDMGPSALSQIVEQLVRVSVALILAVILLKNGVEHASAGAAFGATAGGAAGLGFLCIIYLRRRKNSKKQNGNNPQENFFVIMKRLVKFALPISVAVILMPLLQTLDSTIVPRRLQDIGYTVKQATALLGVLGNAWAVLYLPMIVTSAISVNLVPSISAVKILGRRSVLKSKIEDGIRLAALYLIPVAVIFYLFGKSIYRIIYGIPGIEIIAWLAPAVFFLGMEQVLAGVLQGLGKPNIPLRNFVAGATLKVLLTVILTGWPGFNLAGAALGTVFGSGLTMMLNFQSIKSITGVKLPFLGSAFLSGLIIMVGGWYLRRAISLHYFAEFLLIGVVIMVLYMGILRLTGGINLRDFEMIKDLYKHLKARKKGSYGYRKRKNREETRTLGGIDVNSSQ